MRPSDLDRYNLPAQCRLPLTEHDRKCGEELLQEAFVQRHPEWVKELQIMLKSGEKAEIQVRKDVNTAMLSWNELTHIENKSDNLMEADIVSITY